MEEWLSDIVEEKCFFRRILKFTRLEGERQKITKY